jgi:hypothetical protein
MDWEGLDWIYLAVDKDTCQRDLMFLHGLCRGFRSYGIWHFVVAVVFPDVSKERSALVFAKTVSHPEHFNANGDER